MSTPSPSESPTPPNSAPSPPPGVSGTPSALPPVGALPPVRRRSRTPIYVGVAVGAVVVILLVLVLLPALQPGGPAGGSGSALTFSGARPAADQAVSGYQGGGWTLVAASGLSSRSGVSLPVNGSSAIVTGGSGSCNVTLAPGAPSNLDIPASTANGSSGQAPAWEYIYRNAAGASLLVTEINGTATVVGTFNGASCTSLFGLFQPIPSGIIATPAGARATASAAAPFLASYPNATEVYAVIGGVNFGGVANLGATWIVLYTTCQLTPSAVGFGSEFMGEVNGTTGALLSANTTTNVACGSSSNPAPLQLSSALGLSSVQVTTLPSAYNYTFTVTGVTSGITWNDLVAIVQSTSTPTAAWNLSAVDSTGATIATFNTTTYSWSAGGIQPIAVGDTLVVQSSSDLTGGYLVLEGTGATVTGQLLLAL